MLKPTEIGLCRHLPGKYSHKGHRDPHHYSSFLEHPTGFLDLIGTKLHSALVPDLPLAFCVSRSGQVRSLDISLSVLPPDLGCPPPSGGPPPRQLRPVPSLHPLRCLRCPDSLLTSGSASASLSSPADCPLTHGAARVILLRCTSSRLTKFHWVPTALRRKPTVWGIGAQGSAWSRTCLPHYLIWDVSIPLSTHEVLVSPQWAMQGCCLHPGTRPLAALPQGQQVQSRPDFSPPASTSVPCP